MAANTIDRKRPKPPWLKVRLPMGENHGKIRQLLKAHQLHTVCEEARCPNIGECWDTGTATFMLMGDICTRGCRFCAVQTARQGSPLDVEEPQKLAMAIAELELDYVVLTSVDRDDLPDGGADHFAQTVEAIKSMHPQTIVEVLIPDFCGELTSLMRIVQSQPDVIAHNIETVKRLTPFLRDRRAPYQQSLQVLAQLKKLAPDRYTKSSLMLGVGETWAEILQTLDDLRAHDVDILTLGQYLQPTPKHYEVQDFITPSQFQALQTEAMMRGFLYVASGPLVRSSYKAGEFFIKGLRDKV